MAHSAQQLKELSENAPRYTSYPPINLWENAPADTHNKKLISLESKDSASFYLHFPFCKKLCHFCGCHRKITSKKSLYEEYAETLIKEIELYKTHLKSLKNIDEVHFGGGTPSLIPIESMKKIISKLKSLATENSIEQLSIEVDPRTCSTEHLSKLIQLGFNRFSFGIQDMAPEVQKAIGRVQEIHCILPLVNTLKEHHIHDYNFDLIIGLPKQTLNSVKTTLEICEKLSPSRLALYSYAHMPQLIPNQKLIKEDDLPTVDEKYALIHFAREFLLQHGYVDIGMDHFSKKSDSLNKARETKTLHRNFMGYTTAHAYPMIGLGASSISDFDDYYFQNSKDINTYMSSIEEGNFSIAKSHLLSNEEQITKKAILNLFCNLEVENSDLPQNPRVLENTEKLISKKFIEKTDNGFRVSSSNIPFIRYIAKHLDPLLIKKQTKAFSSGI